MRILHLFNWKIKDIIPEMEIISSQGFDAIQINPLQPLKNEFSNEWWQSYQPCGFRIGNHFGNEEDLYNLCNVATQYDIKIIADVICNHTAGKDDGTLEPHQFVDSLLRDNTYFWKEKRHIYNWESRFEVTNYCLGLPGLRTDNYDLQDIIIKFLNRYIELGIGGFRFDAAKNISLPYEGNDFWPRVLGSLTKSDLYIYGEVIFVSSNLINEYNKYMDVITNSDCNNRDKIIKYIENHDSYLEFGYSRCISSNEVSNYYNELCHEYKNTLYYARPFDSEWKSPIVAQANESKNKVYKKCV